MINYIITALLASYSGIQCLLRDIKLLSARYNYKLGIPQIISYVFLLVGIWIICWDVFNAVSFGKLSLICILTILISFISEWFLAKINPHNIFVSIFFRIIVVLSLSILLYTNSLPYYTPFLIYGLYVRNSFFGSVHGKFMYLSKLFPRTVNVKQSSSPKDLFSNTADSEYKRYNAADYGIHPNTSEDLLSPLQLLLDKIGREGGGQIYFPRGRYQFNKNKHSRNFLQINYSNIILEGETDPDGNPLTEFICYNPLPNKDKNPWLCPFFITTGESLQASNMFWGLQFRKHKKIMTQSNSLSDPGSDGNLSVPPYATLITSDAKAGSNILKVSDSSELGKYILIGMYNTSADGNLIKDILGVTTLRSEWASALRAGGEEAPSFQWLVGVKRIIDNQTIELSDPLFRDIEMKYEPCIFDVEMLENIHIRNLKITSQWNGLFHHHGFPLYYSVGQSKEMDYEWNAINMKRVSHGSVQNVIIDKFTNPLYVQDSYNVLISGINISGYDGHQGIKLYCHTSHCNVSYISFSNHYADMLVAEGNCYCNHFHNISYNNSEFHPVDFDFHGFAEGSMSPPSHNKYSHITGFRYIKGAGTIYNQPASGQNNSWNDITTEGEIKGVNIFYSMPYRPRSRFIRHLAALGTALVTLIKTRKLNSNIIESYKSKLSELKIRSSFPRSTHRQFFRNSHLEGINTKCSIPID